MGHVTFTQRGQRLAPIVLCPNHTLSPIAKGNREHLCAEQDISLNKTTECIPTIPSFLLSCVQHPTLTWILFNARMNHQWTTPVLAHQLFYVLRTKYYRPEKGLPGLYTVTHWWISLACSKLVLLTWHNQTIVASPSLQEVGGGA